MEVPEIKPILEALLFVSDIPLTLGRLKEVLGNVAQKKVLTAIDELKNEYQESHRSFTISEVAEGYQFTTLPHFSDWIKKLYKGRLTAKLSKPALETLAIIAFKQPITRTSVELIRGVDTGGVLAHLLERKLVAITGRESSPGKPLIYVTTKEFLRYFGLNKLSDLPRPKELEELLREREAQQQELFPESETNTFSTLESTYQPAPAETPVADDESPDPLPDESPSVSPDEPTGQNPTESEEPTDHSPQ